MALARREKERKEEKKRKEKKEFYINEKEAALGATLCMAQKIRMV